MIIKIPIVRETPNFDILSSHLAVAGYLKRNNQDDPSNDGYYEFLENARN
jgi:hypothetical protein